MPLRQRECIIESNCCIIRQDDSLAVEGRERGLCRQQIRLRFFPFLYLGEREGVRAIHRVWPFMIPDAPRSEPLYPIKA
jgi:hypothetical protein